MNQPKITIIIPTRNGGKYLPYAVETVLSQKYENLELIISINHSKDNTYEYVKTINDNRVKIVTPPEDLNMTAHYEFALTHATGDWVMILGDDDGIMPYFFELIPYLTDYAEKHNLDAINSQRAYFFWKGCEELYTIHKVFYDAIPMIKINKTKNDLFKCLINYKQYWDCPQMYSTALFSKKFIEKIKSKQNGLFYNSYPPDSNGAAIYMSAGEKYLQCEIPLSWVGTSPKSFGFVPSTTVNKTKEECEQIKEEHKKVAQDIYPWNLLAGNQALLTVNLHLWNSLLYCDKLQNKKLAKLIRSKFVKYFIFAGSYIQVQKITNPNELKTKTEYLNEVLELNKCNPLLIKFIARFILPQIYKKLKKQEKKKTKKYRNEKVISYKNNNTNCDFTIIDAGNRISELGVSNILIKPMIEKYF